MERAAAMGVGGREWRADGMGERKCSGKRVREMEKETLKGGYIYSERLSWAEWTVGWV